MHIGDPKRFWGGAGIGIMLDPVETVDSTVPNMSLPWHWELAGSSGQNSSHTTEVSALCNTREHIEAFGREMNNIGFYCCQLHNIIRVLLIFDIIY